MRTAVGLEFKSRSLILVIDHLPSKFLSPNARVHWSKKHSESSAARSEAGWLAKDKWRDHTAPMLYAIIDYEFTIPVSRRRDQDNLIAACKPWQDGLVDAGVLVQDDTEHLKLGSVSIVKGPRGSTKITVIEVANIVFKGGLLNV